MPDPRGKLITVIAFDDFGNPRSLEVDTADALRVAFEAAAKGLVGTHGWIGAAWQKNPLAFGISGIVEEDVRDASVDAGTNHIDGTAVPAGEYQVITQVVLSFSGTVPTQFRVAVSGLANLIPILTVIAPMPTVWYPATTFVIMQEDDFVRGSIIGATGGDSFDMRYSGYRIDIDQ